MAPPTIYGLVGYPVKHSLSAYMHNAAFCALKINAEYKLFEVRPEELGDFLGSLDKKGINGLNVTVPHKEQALNFVAVDSGSPHLKKIRAINTIAKKSNTWTGFNTDIHGFLTDLKERFNPAGKRTAIIGAGGAGRAIAYALAYSQAKEIHIYDIDSSKAQGVSIMIKELFPDSHIKPADNIRQLEIKEKDLLVNATPVGLKETDPLPVGPDMLHKDMLVYDLIYNPAQTKLLMSAEKSGAGISNGLGMLLHQGALSFKIWTGLEAPIELMRQALQEGVRKL